MVAWSFSLSASTVQGRDSLYVLLEVHTASVSVMGSTPSHVHHASPRVTDGLGSSESKVSHQGTIFGAIHQRVSIPSVRVKGFPNLGRDFDKDLP